MRVCKMKEDVDVLVEALQDQVGKLRKKQNVKEKR